MKRYAFSLVELLIVMAIIILLASLVSAASIYLRRNSRVTQTKAMVKHIEAALIQYQAEYGYYPKQTSAGPLKLSVVDGLVYPNGDKLVDTSEAIFEQSTGTDVVDSFGNPIYYLSPGKMNAKTFDIWSTGFDGKHGNNGSGVADAQTTNENTDDINNWTRK